MNTTNKLTRISGLLYLILIGCGMVGLIYVPSTLVDWTDPSATVANIKASESLFRFGILASTAAYTAFLVMGLTLYQLFKPTDARHAIALLVFVAIGATLGFISIIHHVDVLTLISGVTYLHAIPDDQFAAQVMYLLAAHNNVYLLGHVFWGLWLFPFGYLVYKSGFLPKLLGVALMIACFEYLINMVLNLQFSVENPPFYLSLASIIGEFGICLWMLIVGARQNKEASD